MRRERKTETITRHLTTSVDSTYVCTGQNCRTTVSVVVVIIIIIIIIITITIIITISRIISYWSATENEATWY